MSIHLTIFHGLSKKKYCIQVPGNGYVSKIREALLMEYSLNTRWQSLTYHNEELENCKPLTHYNIHDGSVVVLFWDVGHITVMVSYKGKLTKISYVPHRKNVHYIMKEISQRCKVKMKHHTLHYNDHPLHREQSILETGIAFGDTLKLVENTTAGAEAAPSTSRSAFNLHTQSKSKEKCKQTTEKNELKRSTAKSNKVSSSEREAYKQKIKALNKDLDTAKKVIKTLRKENHKTMEEYNRVVAELRWSRNAIEILENNTAATDREVKELQTKFEEALNMNERLREAVLSQDGPPHRMKSYDEQSHQTPDRSIDRVRKTSLSSTTSSNSMERRTVHQKQTKTRSLEKKNNIDHPRRGESRESDETEVKCYEVEDDLQCRFREMFPRLLRMDDKVVDLLLSRNVLTFQEYEEYLEPGDKHHAMRRVLTSVMKRGGDAITRMGEALYETGQHELGDELTGGRGGRMGLQGDEAPDSLTELVSDDSGEEFCSALGEKL